MKKSIFICLLGFFLSVTISAQTPELVYIRLQEARKGANQASKMVIIKPDNSTETVDLQKLGHENSLGENGILIKKEIEKWATKGFKILSTNSSGGDLINRTEIFMKKD